MMEINLSNQSNKNTIFDDYHDALEVIHVIDTKCDEFKEQSIGYKYVVEEKTKYIEELTTIVEQQKHKLDTLQDTLMSYHKKIDNTTPLRDFLKKHGDRVSESRMNEIKEKYSKYLGERINLNDYR